MATPVSIPPSRITPTHDTFDAWIIDLEVLMDGHAKEHGDRPYGPGTLDETTGRECWRQYYEDGYSPREAFSEDQSYWED